MSDLRVIYLPGGGLPFVEIVVVCRVGGVKSWLQEDTSQGYGLNWGRPLIWEPETYKHLQGKTCPFVSWI